MRRGVPNWRSLSVSAARRERKRPRGRRPAREGRLLRAPQSSRARRSSALPQEGPRYAVSPCFPVVSACLIILSFATRGDSYSPQSRKAPFCVLRFTADYVRKDRSKRSISVAKCHAKIASAQFIRAIARWKVRQCIPFGLSMSSQIESLSPSFSRSLKPWHTARSYGVWRCER